MPVAIACPHCGSQQRVESQRVGKPTTCPACGKDFKVPLPFVLPEEDEPSDEAAEETEWEVSLEEGEQDNGEGDGQRECRLAESDQEALERIDEHIAEHIGEVETVFHEIVSEFVHIDVHWVKPTPERDFHTFITSGMSDLPMSVDDPEEDAEDRFAELLVCLPPDWPISEEAFEDENNFWPIQWLKFLARFPHEYGTWLGPGHTVPNGDPPEPFAPSTGFCCWLLWLPLTAAEDFWTLEIRPGKTINFYALFPLYREEIAFKLKHGLEKLIDRLEKVCASEVIDIHRKNACRRSQGPS